MSKIILLVIFAVLLISAIATFGMFLFSKSNDNRAEFKTAISTSKNLKNDYQISFYRSGRAIFKVNLDGKEVSSIENPEKESTNFLLPVEAGDHEIEIVIFPLALESAENITYAYDLYEFPKGGDQYQIFEDRYKMASSTKPGEITGFIRETIQNQPIKVLIPFTAK